MDRPLYALVTLPLHVAFVGSWDQSKPLIAALAERSVSKQTLVQKEFITYNDDCMTVKKVLEKEENRC